MYKTTHSRTVRLDPPHQLIDQAEEKNQHRQGDQVQQAGPQAGEDPLRAPSQAHLGHGT